MNGMSALLPQAQIRILEILECIHPKGNSCGAPVVIIFDFLDFEKTISFLDSLLVSETIGQDFFEHLDRLVKGLSGFLHNSTGMEPGNPPVIGYGIHTPAQHGTAESAHQQGILLIDEFVVVGTSSPVTRIHFGTTVVHKDVDNGMLPVDTPVYLMAINLLV